MSSESATEPAALAGNRLGASLRFLAAFGASLALGILVFLLLPRQLSAATDIVGYPIYADFNIHHYFQRYYLIVIFLPVSTLVIYHLLGRKFPRACWPATAGQVLVEAESQPNARSLVVNQILRSLAMGGVFGVAWAVWSNRAGPLFWRPVILIAASYALVLLGSAALLALRTRFVDTFARWSALFNAFAAPFTFLGVYAASESTQVVRVADQSTIAYPWMPGWVTALVIAILLAMTILRLNRWLDTDRLRRIEADGLTLIAGSILVFLWAAYLPGPLMGFDTFHLGEILVPARLFADGAFPWRDTFFIHGMLRDVLSSWLGFRALGDTAWTGLAGTLLFAIPASVVASYLLFTYLFRGKPVFLVAFLLGVPTGVVPGLFHARFLPLPFVLLALAALLQRASFARAGLFSGVLLLANLLTPELGFLVPACAAVLLAYEWSQYDRARGLTSNFRRCAFSALTGGGFLLLWFLFLWRHHTAGAFIDYYRFFAAGHELRNGLPIQAGDLKRTIFVLAMVLPVLAVLLAFWYAAAFARMRRQLSVPDWVMLALAAFTLIYYRKFLSRADDHVFQSFAPSFPVLCYALEKALSYLAQRMHLRPLVTHFAGCTALLLILAGGSARNTLQSASAIPSHFRQSVETNSIIPRLGWSHPQLEESSSRWVKIREFLDTYLQPEDPIYDFTNQPALYHYLLGRRPASRFYDVNMAIPRAFQLAVIRELEATRPKLLIFKTFGGSLGDWDGVPNQVRHYEISRYLLQRYRPFALVADEIIYARKDLSLAPQVELKPPSRYLSPDEGYALSTPCNWGFVPNFLRGDSASLAPVSLPATLYPAGNGLQHLEIAGWAVDARTLQPAREILVASHGKVLAHVKLSVKRPDVAQALQSTSATQSGFAAVLDYASKPSEPAVSDLRLYAISEKGAATELAAPLAAAASSRPRELLLESGERVPIVEGAVRGSVDQAVLSNKMSLAEIALPAGTSPELPLGLGITAEGPHGAMLSIGSGNSSGGEYPISFKVARTGSLQYRLLLDSCPQWRAFHRGPIYLSYDPAIHITSVEWLAEPSQPGYGMIP